MFPFSAVGKCVGVVPNRDNTGCYVKIECQIPRDADLPRDCQPTSLDVLAPMSVAEQIQYGSRVEVAGTFYCWDRRKRKQDGSGDMLFTNYRFDAKTVKPLGAAVAAK